jgi:GNAT superfamily N-acetyltransferase
MNIRALHEADIPAVADLLAVLAQAFILHDTPSEARAAFLAQHDAHGVRRMLDGGAVYHVADIDGAIAGFIALRDHTHVFHLFVAQAHHRKGIASALWHVARNAAQDAGNPGRFTVNASNCALAVYEAFGFVRTAPMQTTNSISFNPMLLDGSARG